MGPGTLSQVLRHLPHIKDANLLVGLENSDDAAVYKLGPDLALIQTVDFFTPMVDDPYLFGQIAATNALSDVYAMGGRPLMALNIVCFPSCLPPEVLGAILKGGADKVIEAGAVIAGGHTVQDDEPKYGLAVAGVVHPDQVVTNAGACPGDWLVLTKPLGTGIINTGMKAKLVSENARQKALVTMSTLNRSAARAMTEVGIHACTDITGFGLLGHAAEMAAASGVGLKINWPRVPLLPETLDMAKIGLIPAGAYNNRDFLGDRVIFNDQINPTMQAVLFDPQTSGGLLMAVGADNLDLLLDLLRRYDVPAATVIGRVVPEDGTQIEVRLEMGVYNDR